MSLKVQWYPVQDGISTVICFEVSGEFVVPTGPDMHREAEEIMLRLVSRVTDSSVEELREELEAQKWLGDGPRPSEPSSP